MTERIAEADLRKLEGHLDAMAADYGGRLTDDRDRQLRDLVIEVRRLRNLILFGVHLAPGLNSSVEMLSSGMAVISGLTESQIVMISQLEAEALQIREERER